MNYLLLPEHVEATNSEMWMLCWDKMSSLYHFVLRLVCEMLLQLAYELLGYAQKRVSWGHSDLDRWPQNFKSVHPRDQLDIWTKLGDVPHRRSWENLFHNNETLPGRHWHGATKKTSKNLDDSMLRHSLRFHHSYRGNHRTIFALSMLLHRSHTAK